MSRKKKTRKKETVQATLGEIVAKKDKPKVSKKAKKKESRFLKV